MIMLLSSSLLFVGTFFCTLLPDKLILTAFRDRYRILNKLHALIQLKKLRLQFKQRFGFNHRNSKNIHNHLHINT